MTSLDLDIPLLDESTIDDLSPAPGAGSRKKRTFRSSGDVSSELSSIRHQFEEAIERLRALEGVGPSAPTGPVKLGAMGGIESEPPPYARVKAEVASKGDTYQPSGARDKRAIRRDVDNILESAERMSIEEEINSFTELIRSVQCLNPLFPRIQEIVDRGEMSQPVLLALYRNASRFLQGEISQREKELESTQKEFKKYRESMKRMNNVLGGQKQMPGMAGSGGGAPGVRKPTPERCSSCVNR